MPSLRLIAPTVLLIAASVCAACGGSERPDGETAHDTLTSPPPPSKVPVSPSGDDVARGACDSGESRDCRVGLASSSGTKNCFVGTQVCVDDVWSGCLSDNEAAELLGG